MRLYIVISGIIFLYIVLLFHIYHLQIEKGDYYTAKAESQIRASESLKLRRGKIFLTDKNHNLIPAALNREYPIIYAVPKEVKQIDYTAEIVSRILNLDTNEVKNSLNKPNDLYELLYVKASPQQVADIKAANLDGIYIATSNFRFYPFESLAAQVLGFIGPSNKDDDIRGRYGVELYFDNELSKTPSGQDLVLTIDRNIQAQAEKILNELMERYSASGGTVIVADPKTGKILAMTNAPSFDPNKYQKSSIKNFLNPALEAVYEPGSIFKVLTMAAGIDSGKISPDTKFYDSGTVTLNGRVIKNWDLDKKGPHGWVTMTEVIEQSINTGAVFAQRRMGADIFYNYLLKFGIEEPTGITLPGEVRGNLNNLRHNAQDINFATAAFGQGVAVTPLRLIMAIAAIANDGLMMKPFIIDGTQPTIVRQVVSKESADKITAMMVSAVRKANVAQIPGYNIAGKTGTAQIPNLMQGGYLEDYIHTYVGFAPATNPRFIA